MRTTIARTVERGGTVVIPSVAVGRTQTLIYIPSVAVGRTQTLIYYLWRLRQMGHFTHVPVYLDSLMAGEATTTLTRPD